MAGPNRRQQLTQNGRLSVKLRAVTPTFRRATAAEALMGQRSAKCGGDIFLLQHPRNLSLNYHHERQTAMNDDRQLSISDYFSRAAHWTSEQCGRAYTFASAILIILIWAALGPAFHY